MDKSFKHKLNKYLREIRKLLVGSFNMKSAYICMIKHNVLDIIDENPNITFDELVNIIGTPEEVANNFGKTNVDEVIAKADELKKLEIILIVALFVSIFIIIFLILTYGGAIFVDSEKLFGRILWKNC